MARGMRLDALMRDGSLPGGCSGALKARHEAPKVAKILVLSRR
jgi:hypothetical protein